MSETSHSAALFLNLDLEFEAEFDLSSIVDSFGRKAFVLYCGEAPGGYRLSLEPVIDATLNGDPVACTEHFLDMLEGLSLDVQTQLKACHSRIFDYGFDGGLEDNALHTTMTPEHLARMVKLGIGLRITIYPYRPYASDEGGG